MNSQNFYLLKKIEDVQDFELLKTKFLEIGKQLEVRANLSQPKKIFERIASKYF